jgi:hypothetical protein
MLSGGREVLKFLAYGFPKSLFSMAVTWSAGSLTHAATFAAANNVLFTALVL